MGLPNPSRETKFSGASVDREIFIFPVLLTTSRVGDLTRLIHTLAICVTIHTYILMMLGIYTAVTTNTETYVNTRLFMSFLEGFIIPNLRVADLPADFKNFMVPAWT